MLRIIQIALAALGLMMAGVAGAQAPAGAPSGTTGLCKDGSYTSAATRRGACRGHKGVQTWYTSEGSTAGGAATAPSGAAASAGASGTVTPSTPAPASSQAPAAGGGIGQVWVNKKSKVYHCPGDRYYGKTKSGAYMSEADARSQGYRPDHGKACR
jgi:hypothetical protein